MKKKYLIFLNMQSLDQMMFHLVADRYGVSHQDCMFINLQRPNTCLGIGPETFEGLIRLKYHPHEDYKQYLKHARPLTLEDSNELWRTIQTWTKKE